MVLCYLLHPFPPFVSLNMKEIECSVCTSNSIEITALQTVPQMPPLFPPSLILTCLINGPFLYSHTHAIWNRKSISEIIDPNCWPPQLFNFSPYDMTCHFSSSGNTISMVDNKRRIYENLSCELCLMRLQ